MGSTSSNGGTGQAVKPMASVCVLTTSIGEYPVVTEVTIYRTYEEGQAALYQWCRDRWAEERDRVG
jgi:hypothetical protein